MNLVFPRTSTAAPIATPPMRPHKYLIGQRVIVRDTEIGVVAYPQGTERPEPGKVWIRRDMRGGTTSKFNESEIKPLPNGQM